MFTPADFPKLSCLIFIYFFIFLNTTSVIGHTLLTVMKCISYRRHIARVGEEHKTLLSLVTSCKFSFSQRAAVEDWGSVLAGPGLVDVNRVSDDGTERLG